MRNWIVLFIGTMLVVNLTACNKADGDGLAKDADGLPVIEELMQKSREAFEMRDSYSIEKHETIKKFDEYDGKKEQDSIRNVDYKYEYSKDPQIFYIERPDEFMVSKEYYSEHGFALFSVNEWSSSHKWPYTEAQLKEQFDPYQFMATYNLSMHALKVKEEGGKYVVSTAATFNDNEDPSKTMKKDIKNKLTLTYFIDKKTYLPTKVTTVLNREIKENSEMTRHVERSAEYIYHSLSSAKKKKLINMDKEIMKE
ncbi:DUF6612 family protein [Cohnella terricola]|uniref:Uncharacterized protein n=1 Tax=Cohnella terricola TaxID=1289167 RepID=A0A559J5G9_9BACL|nr:DUF6612 family protein [Cohnella terricola]TVX95091.1 hypothetical protein FPZ45_24105 [Cohnella terricola]